MQYVAEAWAWIQAVEPAWVSAGATLVAAIFASVLGVRWYLLRRDLRGSGAAIIALLGESDHEAHVFEASGRDGSLEYKDETFYFVVGDEHYQLCPRDLERLRGMGYVYRKEHQYRLSRLGHLLLERHDNARLLAKGVARAKQASCLQCNGGLWWICRCKKFWVTWHGKLLVPFPLGQWLTTTRTGARFLAALLNRKRPPS